MVGCRSHRSIGGVAASPQGVEPPRSLRQPGWPPFPGRCARDDAIPGGLEALDSFDLVVAVRGGSRGGSFFLSNGEAGSWIGRRERNWPVVLSGPCVAMHGIALRDRCSQRTV
jgi:hypothetical protein